jgi:hypothetical protein
MRSFFSSPFTFHASILQHDDIMIDTFFGWDGNMHSGFYCT